MEWHPWNKYYSEFEDVDPDEVLKLSEPPCKHCVYWQPKRDFKRKKPGKMEFSGITCCQSNEILSDFSCYEFDFISYIQNQDGTKSQLRKLEDIYYTIAAYVKVISSVFILQKISVVQKDTPIKFMEFIFDFYHEESDKQFFLEGRLSSRGKVECRINLNNENYYECDVRDGIIDFPDIITKEIKRLSK